MVQTGKGERTEERKGEGRRREGKGKREWVSRQWKGGKIEEGEDKVMWQIVSESDSESTTADAQAQMPCDI